MYSRVPTAVEFKTRLGFNPDDPIIRKEESLSTKIKKSFASKEILLQHSALSYRIDLYFPKHKLAIEIDEKGHKDRNKYKEVERHKAIEKELGCKFIRINPDKKDFDMCVEFGKIHDLIKKSSKKSLIEKISKILSKPKFTLKTVKYVVKKYCRHYKTCKLIA